MLFTLPAANEMLPLSALFAGKYRDVGMTAGILNRDPDARCRVLQRFRELMFRVRLEPLLDECICPVCRQLTTTSGLGSRPRLVLGSNVKKLKGSAFLSFSLLSLRVAPRRWVSGR